jgi:hypothetical protein
MFLRITLLLTFSLLLNCCSSQNEESAANAWNRIENIPFENLRTIRVMTAFITDKVDKEQLNRILIQEFGKIGEVHLSSDTPLEKLEEAQAKPFAVLAVRVIEIGTPEYDKTFPIISLECQMLEETKILLNKEKWMSNVWEKIKYIEILQDKEATTRKVSQEIGNLADEFSKNYYKANSAEHKPVFFISNLL